MEHLGQALTPGSSLPPSLQVTPTGRRRVVKAWGLPTCAWATRIRPSTITNRPWLCWRSQRWAPVLLPLFTWLAREKGGNETEPPLAPPPPFMCRRAPPSTRSLEPREEAPACFLHQPPPPLASKGSKEACPPASQPGASAGNTFGSPPPRSSQAALRLLEWQSQSQGQGVLSARGVGRTEELWEGNPLQGACPAPALLHSRCLSCPTLFNTPLGRKAFLPQQPAWARPVV